SFTPEFEPLEIRNSTWDSTSTNFCFVTRLCDEPLTPFQRTPSPSLPINLRGFFESSSTSPTICQSSPAGSQASNGLAPNRLIHPPPSARDRATTRDRIIPRESNQRMRRSRSRIGSHPAGVQRF